MQPVKFKEFAIDVESSEKESESLDIEVIPEKKPVNIREKYKEMLEKLYTQVGDMIDTDTSEGFLTENTRKWVQTVDKMSSNYLKVDELEQDFYRKIPSHPDLQGMIRRVVQMDNKQKKLLEERAKELEKLEKEREKGKKPKKELEEDYVEK